MLSPLARFVSVLLAPFMMFSAYLCWLCLHFSFWLNYHGVSILNGFISSFNDWEMTKLVMLHFLLFPFCIFHPVFICIVRNLLCVWVPVFFVFGFACAFPCLPYFLQWFRAFLHSFLLSNCSLLHLLLFTGFSRCHFPVLRNFCSTHFASFCVPGLLQVLFLVMRFGLLTWCIFSLFSWPV